MRTLDGRPVCDGCGLRTEKLVAYRPDAMGDVFELCDLCRAAVVAATRAMSTRCCTWDREAAFADERCCTECGHQTRTVSVQLDSDGREHRFCGGCVKDLWEDAAQQATSAQVIERIWDEWATLALERLGPESAPRMSEATRALVHIGRTLGKLP